MKSQAGLFGGRKNSILSDEGNFQSQSKFSNGKQSGLIAHAHSAASKANLPDHSITSGLIKENSQFLSQQIKDLAIKI